LNYSGKFDAKFPVDGSGSNGHGHVDTFSAHATHAPADAIVVPDAHLLFNGDFKRSGVDLVLSKDDQELVLHDYFKGEKRAALASPDGAHLTGDIVNALTGHVEYAQADGSASVSKVIGHVTKLVGTATAVRNGVSIILNQGDNVEKGDVVQSGAGSTLGITFIDGTVFGLSSNARMVLNEMVYDPNGSNNSSLLSLVAGTITFVAGETAKHGDMKIDTPVATMGIRGTAVLVEIDFDAPGQGGLPDAKFQVLVEPDGTTGSYILFDKTTLTPLAVVDKAGQQINISNGTLTQSSTGLSSEIQKLITDVFSIKFTDTNTKSFDHHTDTPIPQGGCNYGPSDRFAATYDRQYGAFKCRCAA
jgi:fibronectin-binding autotransporter adhesin